MILLHAGQGVGYEQATCRNLNPSYFPAPANGGSIDRADALLTVLIRSGISIENGAIRTRWPGIQHHALAELYPSRFRQPARRPRRPQFTIFHFRFRSSAYLHLRAAWTPARFSPALASLFLVLGFSVTATSEWVREAVRKPFIIHQVMYSNGLRPSEVQEISRTGFLQQTRWAKIREVTSSNRLEAGEGSSIPVRELPSGRLQRDPPADPGMARASSAGS
jgi:hypothetical protein